MSNETPSVTESRIEITDRLRRAGRWNDASALRDVERQRLKAEGVPRQEAIERSWEAMREKFPPLPSSEPSGEPLGIDDEVPHHADPNLKRDVVWVYDHLDRRKTTPGDAPTAGAWGLLQQARKDRAWFFGTMLPKAMPKEEIPPPDSPAEQEDPTRLLIDDLLARAAEAAKGQPVVCPKCGESFYPNRESPEAGVPIEPKS